MSDSPAPVSPQRTSLIAGASWLFASKICAFAITTALPLILVRRLSQTEYGYYKQLFVLLNTGLNLLPFGMNMSLFYFIPRAKSEREKGNIVLNVVIFYVVMTGIAGGLLMINPGLVQQLFHSAPLTVAGRLIGLTMIPYIVAALFESVLIANGDAKLSALANVAVNMARTVLILGAAFLWGTIASIVWCVLIVAASQCFWLALYIKNRFGEFWRSFRWHLLQNQLIYAFPLGLASFIWSVQVDVDNYFVSHYFNAAMFAIYATGCFDVPLVGMLADSVGSMLIPRISSLQATQATGEIIPLTVKTIRALSFAYAPIFFFCFVAARQFITMLFRADYLASVPIFRVNVLMVLLAIVAVDPILRAFKSEHLWMLRLNASLLGLLLVGLYFGTTRYGLMGAVSCVVGVQYVGRAFLVWRISRLLNVQWADLMPLKDVLKNLFSAGLAALCILPLLEPVARGGALLSVLVCGTVFMGIYVGALLLMKVPTKSELDFCRTRTVGFAQVRLRALGIG
jgi:O-antigen/teichoic acid export membrane protein